jgi:phage major head subunit gpT-like protein
MARPITAVLLALLFTGFKTNYRGGFAGVEPDWQKIATKINSSTAEERYDWLNEWPAIRKWIGERVLKELAASTYTVVNEPFESTVRVKRDNVEDDRVGIYAPMFEELGRSTAVFPDELIFALLVAGLVNKCYDGQPFFDDEHPVGGGVASNFTAGAGPAWYLLDVGRALKPLIFQERRPFELTALDNPTDPNVFFRSEYIYGVDGRFAAGYGFWQMAHCSKATLDGTNFSAARATMRSLKSDEGKPLGIGQKLILAVPPSLEGAGRTLLTAETINNTTNVWRGTAELLVSPYLA